MLYATGLNGKTLSKFTDRVPDNLGMESFKIFQFKLSLRFFALWNSLQCTLNRTNSNASLVRHNDHTFSTLSALNFP